MAGMHSQRHGRVTFSTPELPCVMCHDEDDDGVALENGKRLSGAAVKKARKHDFYLGLESTWLYK